MSNTSLEERKQRHQAFWEMKPVDRPLVLVHRPNPSHTAEDDYLDSLKTNDLQRFGSDPEILIRRAKQQLRQTKHLGDAIPLLRPPFGPTMLSAFLGARVEIAPDTVWFHPTVNDLADLENVSFDPSNPWWKIVEECALRVSREPEAIPVVLDLGGLGDSLAALIGSETLMFEMLERPELVKKVLRRMLDITKLCYEKLYAIAECAGKGTGDWLGLWSPKKTGIVQNDFSIMLSTPMYREFFSEEFEELCAFFDHRLFHVDGTRSQQHIEDFLVKIPGLHGCQLGSDPGTSAMQILPTIKTLQSCGKCVFTYVFPDEIESLFAEISPNGVCVITSVDTDQEVDSIIQRLTDACKKNQSCFLSQRKAFSCISRSNLCGPG